MILCGHDENSTVYIRSVSRINLLNKMVFFFIFSNNRRRQLSGSSMISQFGGGSVGSNNNSQAGSESPLPSPRFTRYIRTPQTSDTNNTGGVNSENSRPCSATSSSTYSPRLGKICSQPPSVHIGEFMNCGLFWKDLVLFKLKSWTLFSQVFKYLHTFKKCIASLTFPSSVNLILTRGADYIFQKINSKIWLISALESRNWLNWKNKGPFIY
jgi:hypothetical protein